MPLTRSPSGRIWHEGWTIVPRPMTSAARPKPWPPVLNDGGELPYQVRVRTKASKSPSVPTALRPSLCVPMSRHITSSSVAEAFHRSNGRPEPDHRSMISDQMGCSSRKTLPCQDIAAMVLSRQRCWLARGNAAPHIAVETCGQERRRGAKLCTVTAAT